MPLPNLIVIGSGKCGTTSLHFQLRHHPEIDMPRDKELNFFVAERNWEKGVEWYASRFRDGTRIRGETSPSYTMAGRLGGVPARMHSLVPDARLVYLVRDPIERVISAYVHRVAAGKERRSLEEAASEENPYVDPSRYWRQISEYLEFYPRSRILVVGTDDLARDNAATIRRVLEFLDVDPDYPLPELHLHDSDRKRAKTRLGLWVRRSRAGRSVYRLPQWIGWGIDRALYRFPPMSRPLPRPAFSPSGRAALAERLRDDTNRFREFAGREFAGWSV